MNSDYLKMLVDLYGWMIALLLVLIALDFVTGVGSAVRRGAFSWEKLGEFYRTLIVPKLIGFVGVATASEIVSKLVIPSDVSLLIAPYVGRGVSMLFYLPTLAHLLASIKSNFDEIQRPGSAPEDAG